MQPLIHLKKVTEWFCGILRNILRFRAGVVLCAKRAKANGKLTKGEGFTR